MRKCEMTYLEKEINYFFNLCKELNKSMSRVDLKNEHLLSSQIEKQSRVVFQLLENEVNPMNVRIISKLSDRNMLVELVYVLLKCVILLSSTGVTKFEGERSIGSYDLSKRLFIDLGFDKNTLNNPSNWMLNNTIFTKCILTSMCKIHPTLLQNIIRCLSSTLLLAEIKEKPIYNYLSGFENYFLYYLTCGGSEQIYLDYV